MSVGLRPESWNRKEDRRGPGSPDGRPAARAVLLLSEETRKKHSRWTCVSYLQLQSSIAARLNHIEALEASIEKKKADNDALETRINTSIDLDNIYKIATEELGMVYANKDQVRMYNKTESEYVRQYEDIPER